MSACSDDGAAAVDHEATADARSAASDATRTAETEASATLVRKRLWEGFRGTSWFTLSRRIDVQGSAVMVHTDVFPDAAGKQSVMPLCVALAGIVAMDTPDLQSVRVFGESDIILVSSIGRGSACEAR